MKLAKEESVFINKIAPYCDLTSQYIKEKHLFMRRNAAIVHPLVILAHIVINSQWGTHPLSQQLYIDKPANNLALLEEDHLWDGKTAKYDGKKYKLYQSWNHFSTDYSDSVVFNGKLSCLIKDNTIKGQIRQLAALTSSPNESFIFAAKAESIIEIHGLALLFPNFM